MDTYSTQLLPGVYRYHYPTFVDEPQHLCIHFLTSDCQQAYVSYPNHSRKKAAQLIPISWFQSVILEQLDAEPRLMQFLDITFLGWLIKPSLKLVKDEPLNTELGDYTANVLLAA